MNYRSVRILSIIIMLCSSFVLFSSGPAISNASAHDNFTVAPKDFRLEIPSIGMNLSVVTAPFVGETWDFSHILYRAGYMAGTALPGTGGNVVIGAHSELAKRRPGPFYTLGNVQVGAEVLVIRAGKHFTYRVTTIWTVTPDDATPVYSTDHEVLTLLTCSGYDDGDYSTRLVVRAEPVSA